MDANKAVIQRFIEELWNGGKLDVADEMIAPDCVSHTLQFTHMKGEDRVGPRQIKAIVQAWRRAFPDWRIEITDMLADGDKVVLASAGHGTHRGELMGVPATGRRVTFTSMRVFRLAEGMVKEYWVLWDWLGLWQQIGVLPPEQRAAFRHFAAR